MAIAIVEDLWGRIRAHIDDKNTAAEAAAVRAEAGATAVAADRTHVDSQVSAIDTAFTESVPPYLQPDSPGGLNATYMRGTTVSPDRLSNHTQALQAKIDAIAAAGGGFVHLLPGNYQITDTVTIHNGVSLQGSGENVTTINAHGIPKNAAALHLGPTSVGATVSGFTLNGTGGETSAADGVNESFTVGLHMGRVSQTDVGQATDFLISSVRIVGFKTGISGIYVWCGKFVNVRLHLCGTGLRMGPQVNATSFNGSMTTYRTNAAKLTNVECFTFDTANFDPSKTPGSNVEHAIKLFQSQAVLIQPYFENVAKLAEVGGSNEAAHAQSTFFMMNGRVSGVIELGGYAPRITILNPWVMATGPGLPLGIDVEGGNLGKQPREIMVEHKSSARGVQKITSWDARDGVWDFANAYGGEGVTAVQNGDYFTATSPATGQGIRFDALTVGEQYVLSYRIRKAEGVVSLREGSGLPYAVAKVEDVALGFEVVHTPFIARDTVLRMLWNGELDIQWVSLTKGLNFLDR